MEERKRSTLYSVIAALMVGICFALAFFATVTLFALKASAAVSGEVNTCIDAWIDYDDCSIADDIYYASGSNPVLTAEASEDLTIHVQIKNESPQGGWVKTFEDAGVFEYEFDEGVYEVSIFGKCEGKTDNIYVKNFPLKMVYDNTPPDNPVTRVVAPGAVNDGGNIYCADSVRMNFESEDSLSGIKSIFVRCGGGDPQACDSIVIESGGCEMLEVWSEDKCGNISDICVYDKAVLVDRDRPEISWERSDGEDGGLGFEIGFSDDVSGLSSAAVYVEDKPAEKYDFVSDEKGRGRKEENVRFSLSREETEAIGFDEAYEIRLYCEDLAGNDKSVILHVNKKDEVPPFVSLSGVGNGMVTNGPVRLNLDVGDDNLSRDLREAVSLEVRHTGFEEPSRQEVETEYPSPYDSLVFYEDGRYEIAVTAVDLAGNSSNDHLEFIIDNTPPRICGLDAYDGIVTDSFRVVEDDMRKMFVDASIVRYQLYLNGKNYRENELVDTPGKYRFEVAAVDQTGNVTRDSARFTIKNEREEKETGEMMTAIPEGISGEALDTGTLPYGGTEEKMTMIPAVENMKGAEGAKGGEAEITNGNDNDPAFDPAFGPDRSVYPIVAACIFAALLAIFFLLRKMRRKMHITQ